MRYVPVNHLQAGMVLGKTLLGVRSEIILKEGTTLSTSHIEKIINYGYNGIYIDDPLTKDIAFKELISPKLKAETVNEVKCCFQNTKNNVVSWKNIKNLRKLVEEIIDEVSHLKDEMVNIVDIKAAPHYIYYHSVNVAVHSVLVGMAMNLRDQDLYDLGLSALLHDLGKAMIPFNCTDKPDKMSDEEYLLLQEHPEKGYRYLKTVYGLSTKVIMGILDHHEKFDGSGYPKGKKGEEISLFGRIINVVDAYDVLVSERTYQRAMLPSEAMEYILGASGHLFDPDVCSTFSRKVAPYPTGTFVKLSNRTVALVLENYMDCCMRPLVKVLRLGDKEIPHYKLDLRNNLERANVTIIGIAR